MVPLFVPRPPSYSIVKEAAHLEKAPMQSSTSAAAPSSHTYDDFARSCMTQQSMP